MHMQKVARHPNFRLADDATAVGKLEALRMWWDEITEMGTRFGYYVNASKSCLILKSQELASKAAEIFEGSNISIRHTGHRHLGAPLGNTSFKSEYISSLVKEWSGILENLVHHSKTQPHAAYSAFTKGVRHKLTYFMRTIPGLGEHLRPLDNIISERLLPSFFGCLLSPLERKIMSLPPRLGGLGIPILEELAEEEYSISTAVTKSLVMAMADKEDCCGDATILEEMLKKRETRYKDLYENIVSKSDALLQRHLEEARKEGASSWLTALPLSQYDFALNKGEFRDGLLLRYGKNLPRLPDKCVCGEDATPTHLINFRRGGYVIYRHNKLCDILAGQLATVCNDVEREPDLQAVDGETFTTRMTATEDSAKPDIRAHGFYRDGQNAFFDIQLINPNSRSYLNKSVKKVFENCESNKRNKYNERILHVERGTFTPLIFSIKGGYGPEYIRM